MRNFFLLLKCDLLKLFDINKTMHEKSASGKVKLMGIFLAIILVGVIIAVVSGSYTMLFASVLPDKKDYLALSYICFIYSTLIFFTTIGASKVIFGAKDYETIMAFPVSSYALMLSKLAYIYIVNTLLCMVTVIPSSIVYVFRTDASAISILYAIISAFFVPLFPMTLGLILGTIVNIIMAKVKYKGVIGVILSIIFFAGYFVLFLVLSSGLSNEKISDMLLSTTKYLGIFNVYAKGVSGDLKSFLIFLAIALIITICYVLILGATFKKINTLISSKTATGKYVSAKQTQHSVFYSMFTKDLRRFFSSITMVINSLFGPLISILLAVVFISQGGMMKVAESIDDIRIINTVKRLISSFLPYLPLLFIGITTYSAYSISVEGHSLWIIKSMPVPIKNIVLSKLAVNWVMTMPAGILAVIVYGIAFESVWYDIVISACIVAMYAVLGGVMGVFVNLKVNNFDWTTDAEVVKRGTSTTICSVVGIVAVIPLAFIQYLTFRTNKYIGYGIVFAIILLSTIIFSIMLHKTAEKSLMKAGN